MFDTLCYSESPESRSGLLGPVAERAKKGSVPSPGQFPGMTHNLLSYMGIMENKMETTIVNRGYIGIFLPY